MTDRTAMPEVSVIMCFFNAEQFIAEAIDSLLAQTVTALEVLLVDDGATDGSRRIADDYAARDARVRVLEHPGRANHGVGAARDLGMGATTGRWVTFLDADDVLLPTHLERHLDAHRQHPDVEASCGPAVFWRSWDGGPDSVSPTAFPPGTVVTGTQVLSATLRRSAVTPPVCCTFVDGELARTRRGVPTQRAMFEDRALFTHLLLDSNIVYLGEPTALYRRHDASMTRTSNTIGDYNSSGRPSATELLYLEWVESYLDEHGIDDRELRWSLALALLPYRRPRIGHVLLAVRRTGRSLAGLVPFVARPVARAVRVRRARRKVQQKDS